MLGTVCRACVVWPLGPDLPIGECVDDALKVSLAPIRSRHAGKVLRLGISCGREGCRRVSVGRGSGAVGAAGHPRHQCSLLRKGICIHSSTALLPPLLLSRPIALSHR